MLQKQFYIKHYSIRAEENDISWMRKYILFHKKKSGNFRHPFKMGILEVNHLPNYPDAKRKVSSFWNPAFS